MRMTGGVLGGDFGRGRRKGVFCGARFWLAGGLEYEAVVTRADHLAQSGLTVEETNAVIDALAAVMEPVNLRFLWRPRLKDPNDEMVLETAVNGYADHIVTFNVRHLEKEAAAFAIKASQPRDILQVMRRAKRGEIL